MNKNTHNFSVPQRVAWLIPCHNESVTIAKQIADIKRHAPLAAIYVYDNASSDGTAECAKRAGAEVVFELRRGKGNVVRSMFERIEADLYILVDGDDTYDISSWQKLAHPILEGQAEMVVGRRLEESTKAYRPFHVMGNRIITSLLNVFFRVELKDVLSGYRAFSRSFVKGISINAKGFEVECELTIQALENRFRILEVETPYRARPLGSFSKLNTFQDGFLIVYSILRLVKDFKPLTVFGSLGALLIATGFALGFFGVEPIYAVAVGVVGALVVCTGIVLNAISQRVKELGQILRKSSSQRIDPAYSSIKSEDPFHFVALPSTVVEIQEKKFDS